MKPFQGKADDAVLLASAGVAKRPAVVTSATATAPSPRATARRQGEVKTPTALVSADIEMQINRVATRMVRVDGQDKGNQA